MINTTLVGRVKLFKKVRGFPNASYRVKLMPASFRGICDLLLTCNCFRVVCALSWCGSVGHNRTLCPLNEGLVAEGPMDVSLTDCISRERSKKVRRIDSGASPSSRDPIETLLKIPALLDFPVEFSGLLKPN